MQESYFQIEKFQNKINHQSKVFKIVLYSTAVLFVLVSFYFALQLINLI